MAEPTPLLGSHDSTNRLDEGESADIGFADMVFGETGFADSGVNEAEIDLGSDLAKSEIATSEEAKVGRLKRASATKSASQMWPN
jgi:hypothetical protein